MCCQQEALRRGHADAVTDARHYAVISVIRWLVTICVPYSQLIGFRVRTTRREVPGAWPTLGAKYLFASSPDLYIDFGRQMVKVNGYK